MNTIQPKPFSLQTFPSDIMMEAVLSDEKTLVLKVSQHGQSKVMKVFPLSSTHLYDNEVKIGTALNHPNILPISYSGSHVEIQPNHSYSYVLTPFCANGTLYDLLIKKIKFNEIQLRTYFHQLVEAIDHMHKKDIFHLDLKPCNVLVDEDFQFRIFDFDFSHKKGDKILGSGTPNYRAPEVMKGKPSKDHDKCDVYTLGVMLFTMHNGCREPFLEEQGVFTWKRAVFDQDITVFWQEMTNFFSKYMKLEWSEEFKELFEGMVLRDPVKRWSLKQVKESKWYNGDIMSNDELKSVMKIKYASSN